jgi:hypothetical protein
MAAPVKEVEMALAATPLADSLQWSGNGRYLLYRQPGAGTDRVFMLDVTDKDKAPQPLGAPQP